MECYSKTACTRFPLKSQSDDWLCKQQGLALPILPPTTLEARKYFFSQICNFAQEASSNGKQKVDFETFTCQWNITADGKECFYVSVEVLSSYAKSWEKVINNCASEELISEQLHQVCLSGKVFAAPDAPFPSYLMGTVQSLLVMSRGNPWVQQAIPIPLPPKTPTPHQGYGFLKGLNIHTLTPTPHTLD